MPKKWLVSIRDIVYLFMNETNDNENTTTQNLKEVLRGTLIALQSYLKKQAKHQIDNLTLHLKQLEKEEGEQQQKPQN